VLTGGLIAARFCIAAWRAYGVTPEEQHVAPETDPARWLLVGPAIVLAGAAFGLGAIPWSGISVAVTGFGDPCTIVDALLHHPLPLPQPLIAEPSNAHVLLLAGATVAVGAAAVAMRPAVRSMRAFRRLHNMHNGSVGDYVTWLSGATAAITALLVLLH
jgi:hypothetical protein